MYMYFFFHADQSHIWWIKDLHLYLIDKEHLINGSEVSDNVINAAQLLLKHQFPHVAGFQNTILGYNLKFASISSLPAIQILHSGNLFLCCK